MFKLFTKKAVEMVTINGINYCKNGEAESIEFTTFANDNIGIANFIFYTDEVIEIIYFTK